jgi:RNA polymerase sigma-70 factor (ECF subfamily)
MELSAETVLFNKIKKGDEKAFETLFHQYYSYLCLYASKIIENDIAAEEIVQGFFVGFWEKREKLNIETSIKNYLFRSIKNLCLNYIKHNKIKARYAQDILAEANSNSSIEDRYIEIDLALKIKESIQSLPEKRRKIFQLSREEGLKYREIAEKLNISIKTVEAQMSLAFKYLRNKLEKYNTFLTLFLCFYKK